MVIFPLAPDQTIAQMWSSGARGGLTCNLKTAAKTNICYSITYKSTSQSLQQDLLLGQWITKHDIGTSSIRLETQCQHISDPSKSRHKN